MLVVKFGGTSVGKPERMKKIANLVLGMPGKKIVVLSALSGTTNTLVKIGDHLIHEKKEDALAEIVTLEKHYISFIGELYTSSASLAKGQEIVKHHFDHLRSFTTGKFNDAGYRDILAQGELISTQLFFHHLQEIKVSSCLLAALDFMSIDENHEPELDQIEKKIKPILERNADAEILVTQGYICRNHKGEIDNLKRGGSDYTASLIGAAVRAEEIQIWTDIDGMHNNDPRIVKKTFPIAALTFDEASELAYFGAKILHPSTIVPAQKFGVPVILKNTMNEKAAGTIISNKEGARGQVKAVAAKDGITVINIKSSRMLLAYGFLRRVFEVFENHKTPIDMISTSEVAVSVTIDDNHALAEIEKNLNIFGTVEIDKDQSIICIVGNMLSEKHDVLKLVFDALEGVPVRMVSYGGSHNNISLVIDTSEKIKALTLLNEGLFGLK